MKKLTTRQIQVYDLIKRHIAETSLPPTRAEIAKALGFKSVNAAEDHLRALARKGAIDIMPGCSRGIKLLLEDVDITHSAHKAQIEHSRQKKSSQQNKMIDPLIETNPPTTTNEIIENLIPINQLINNELEEQERELFGLPLIGRVAAGDPILAIEHIEAHYTVDPDMFKPRADFLLRICGDSMINIGIFDGDLLAVHKTNIVRNGQIVVARLEDEVTVKRFEKRSHLVYLHPENDDFKPYVIDPQYQEITIEGLAVGIIRNNF